MQPRTARATDPQRSRSWGTLSDRGEVLNYRTASTPAPAALAEGEELAADDGSSDGRGLLEDGLTMVVRLTPLNYPARLTAIRVFFVGFRNEPEPAGRTVRLLAFAGSGPTPPPSPKFLVDREVKVPSTGTYVDFSVENAPEIREGDIFVGYQTPRPANGVGFGTDTEGPQSQRTFWSEDGGATWGGPLSFTDGTKANAMIRARVSYAPPDAGDFELRTDDGSVESGLIRDGGLYVNRLTPPRYPATLKKIRIYVVKISDQPAPDGKTANLIVFRDAAGTGAPPDNPKIDLRKAVQLGNRGAFTEVDINGLTIESGDVYVGYEAPTPHDGVAFALDTDGQPYNRMYRSRDGGKTFSGPVLLNGDNDQTLPANLMVRGVISLGQAKQATHTLVTSTSEIDLGEGGAEQFDCGVHSASSNTSYRLSAQFDPPVPGLSVTLSKADVRAGEAVKVTVQSQGYSDADSGQLTVSASDGDTVVRTIVPVYLWRQVAAQAITPEGGSLEAQGLTVEIPRNGFRQTQTVRLLTGRPATGMEESLASPAFRVEGFPDKYDGGLQIRFAAPPAAQGKSRMAEGDTGGVAVVRFSVPDSSGKIVPVDQFQPTAVRDGSAVLNFPPGKPAVSRRFSLWMLTGWLNLVSEHGNFLVFYPVNYRGTAVWAAERLEEALLALTKKDVDISLLDRITYLETARLLGYAVHPIRVTLQTQGVPGRTNGGQITLSKERMSDLSQRDQNRSTPGHELMHIAQDLYGAGQGLLDSLFGTDPRIWADDAQATWFEPFAVNDSAFVPPSMHEHLRDFLINGPLLVPADGARDYGYGASSFIAYLHKYVDKSIPSKWVAQRAPDRAPWALLLPLMGGDRELPRHWRVYSEYLFTHQLLTDRKFPNAEYLMPLEDKAEFVLLRGADYEVKTWSGARDLSVNFYKLSFPPAAEGKKLPDLTDSTALGFKLMDKYDDVDLYVLAARDGEMLGMQRGPGEVVLGNAAGAMAKAPLLLAVVNNSYDPAPATPAKRDIRVRMGLAEPTVMIQGNIGGDLVIGATYNFTTRNLNVSRDAAYSWNFGNGLVATARDAKASWNAAGTYQVRVDVNFGATRISDVMEVRVAPDSKPAVKADVLFEVYRLLKNPMGTSNQKCNEYYIELKDVKGSVVESGNSIAKNGAYETRLEVADGYSYSIRYNYISPCRDTGTASSRFDVKPNTVNYVRVETPRCETN